MSMRAAALDMLGTNVMVNIDSFHKNPAHQRNLLAVFYKPFKAMVQVDKRSFDLLVVPMFENGERTDFVVEWAPAKT